MKIKITNFAKRHFDPNFGGTKILDIDIQEFKNKINSEDILESLKLLMNVNSSVRLNTNVVSRHGYAPFCKLVAIKNFTDAKVGSLPIIIENYQYLRSGYSARTETELPVFSRWFELPVSAPKAEYLILVLYNSEQLEKEYLSKYLTERFNSDEIDMFNEDDINFFKNSYDYNFELDSDDYGVVAILGQSHDGEEPMKTETMLRNCLGIEYGGSGVSLNKEEYLKSVNFWNTNATVK